MKFMNVNQLAVKVCKLEGKKKQVDIAQVKEILRCLARINKRHHGGVEKTLRWYTARLK